MTGQTLSSKVGTNTSGGSAVEVTTSGGSAAEANISGGTGADSWTGQASGADSWTGETSGAYSWTEEASGANSWTEEASGVQCAAHSLEMATAIKGSTEVRGKVSVIASAEALGMPAAHTDISDGSITLAISPGTSSAFAGAWILCPPPPHKKINLRKFR